MITVYFKRPTAWTQTPNIYFFSNNGSETSAGWPGQAMTSVGGGLYSYNFPTSTSTSLIFNNSPTTSDQTVNLTQVSPGQYAAYVGGSGATWFVTWFTDNPDTVSANLTSGITNYFKLDENTGTAVNDSVGSNNGTLAGTTPYWTPGIINSGFNGIATDYVDFGSNTIFSTFPISISFWLYYSQELVYQRIMGRYTSGAWCIELANTVPAPVNFNFFGGASHIALSSLTNGTWNHIVCTYDPTTLQEISIYMNGVLNTTFNNVTTTQNGTGVNFYMSDNSAFYITGVLDEVGFWNRILYPSDVVALYNSGAGLQYPFATGATLKIGYRSLLGVGI